MAEQPAVKVHWSLKPIHFCIHALHRRWHVRYRYNPKHLVADLMLAATVLALIVINVYIFFVFTKWTAVLQLQLNVEAPPVASGLPTTVTVNYRNTAYRGAVTDATLMMKWPSEFTVTAVDGGVYDAANGQVTVGTVPARGRGQVIFSGVWWADDGQRAPLTARLIYTQESPFGPQLSWEDGRTTTGELMAQGSGLDCTVAGQPDPIVTETPFAVTVNCLNRTAETITDVTVQLPADRYAVEFDETKALPDARWLAGTLEAGAELTQVFTLTRQTTTDSATADDFSLIVTGTRAGRRYALGRPTWSWPVYQPQIEWRLLTNESDQPAHPFPGETVNYTMVVANRETTTWQNPVVRLDFSNSAIDPDSLTSANRGWTKTATGWELARPSSLASQESWTNIDFSVTMKRRLAGETTAVIRPELTYERSFAGGDATVTARGPQWSDALSTDLTANVTARYYTRDGIQLGLGPLPPIVGFPTRYRLFAVITNNLNDVTNGRLTMTLPAAVFWDQTCPAPAERVKFDDQTRRLTIDFGTIAASGAQNSAVADASWCLTIIPTATQVGSWPVLASAIKFTGQDAVTGRDLERGLGIITTELPDDSLANKRGKVIQ